MATTGQVADAFSSKGDYDVIMYIARYATSGNSTRWAWSLVARRFNPIPSYVLDPQPWAAHVEGDDWTGSTPLDFRYTTEILLGEGITGWKAHNSDGYLTVNFSFAVGPAPIFGSAAASSSIAANRIPKAPDAPPTATISSKTSSSIVYTISPPADNGGSSILDYFIQVATDSGFSSVVQSRTATGSSQSFTGLSSNTTYYMRYRARNAIGNSSYSGTRSGATNAAAPGAPTGLTTTDIGPGGVTLDWTAPASNGGSAITSYRVRRSTNSDMSGSTEFAVTAPTTELTLADMLPSTRYYFQVVAVNAIGTSPASTPVLAVDTTSGAYYSNGTAWLPAGVYVSDGTTWQPATIEVSDGSIWLPAN